MLLDSPLPRHMPSSLHTALDSLVRTIAHQYPGAGIRMVQSHLLTHGYRVQQARVRNSLERVDPHGLAVRWSTYGSIHRRVYRVAYPNAVWHADGNLALIRWGFVIHGGVDGYSRLVVYLQCSTNNCAETVLRQFLRAGHQYGFPSRVRSDFGGGRTVRLHSLICYYFVD